MNSGIQDAFNFGWKLALVQQSLAPSSLLQTYSEERIPVTREMLDLTTRLLTRTFSDAKSKSKSNTHGTGLGGLLQLGINYWWSPIVLDELQNTSNVIDPYGDLSGAAWLLLSEQATELWMRQTCMALKIIPKEALRVVLVVKFTSEAGKWHNVRHAETVLED
ncbi:hypothetical protein H0H87_003512 [Tephrocybe sp. NHM501043]|nr:hypothetical protein H0H87_003512 [Tephrocybe sp. NHM501043]